MHEDPEFLEQVRAQKWMSGDLRYLTRPGKQREVYDWQRKRRKQEPSLRPFVGQTRRRFGKSMKGLIDLTEICLAKPDQQCYYIGPTEEQAMQIFEPNMSILYRQCPDFLRPKKSGSNYIFQNPAWGNEKLNSELHVRGINQDRGNAMRGKWANGMVFDEAREMKYLDEFIEHVMVYMFEGIVDPYVLIISTQPDSAAHPFTAKYVARAIAQKRFFEVKASEDPDYTKEDEEFVLQVLGSKDSISWRREMECEPITDPRAMVIPEIIGHEDDVFCEFDEPEVFLPRSCIDAGVKDFTHCLFGYVDFHAQTLNIARELVLQYANTQQLAAGIREQEEALTANLPQAPKFEPIRFADAPLQQLLDLEDIYKLEVAPARKGLNKPDGDSLIAKLRTAILTGKVKIHTKNCPNLIYQIKNGTKDQKGNWLRTETMGHLDGIAALAYMLNEVHFDENPGLPLRRGWSRQDVLFPPRAEEEGSWLTQTINHGVR